MINRTAVFKRALITLLNALLFVGFGILSIAAGAQEKQADYLLAVGDIVRVTVFQNPDLTLETRVAESGAISFCA